MRPLGCFVASRLPDAFIVMNELLVRAARDAAVRDAMAGMQATWRDYLVGVCRQAGAAPKVAAARAERCQRELLGMGLELGLGRTVG